jgi:thymidine phosphorylase
MRKIIDAQGPSDCRADLGNLTFDVMAGSDGFVSGIDCLQLNRLARTAGAPLDKGAGIRLFKKIGDRVESGEPLDRVHTFDRSERDLTAAGANGNSGYAIESSASSSNKTTP